MARSILQRLHLLLWTTLVLLLGYFFGSFFMTIESAGAPEPVHVLRSDIHRRAPVVRIGEIREGKIVGMIGTGARLVIGDTVVTPNADRTFSVPATPFLQNIVEVSVPRGVQFVASKRGKNYYPVTASAAERLKPENRLYFRNASEAEAMGYKRAQ